MRNLAIAGAVALVALVALALPVTRADEPVAAPSATPRKTPWTAELFRETGSAPRIAGLIVDDSRVPITLLPKEGHLRPLIEIRGKLNRPGWDLAVEGSPVAIEDGRFAVHAFLKSRYAEISFAATGPRGERETERVIVLAPDAQEFRIAPAWGELLLSAGGVGIAYYQSGYGQFTSKAALLSAEYFSPPVGARWNLLASLGLTVGTFSANAPYGPAWLAASVDAAYLLTPDGSSRFQLSGLGGIGYLTMFSNGSPFGFANLIAPQLGARASFALGGASQLVGELRFAPLGGIFDVKQRGVDGIFGWNVKLPNLHRLELDFGVSDWTYLPDGIHTLDTTLWIFRVGYSI
jgi:hypothetical protein